MDHQFAKQLQGKMCAGSWNLLHNCADLQPDGKLLLICEDPALGWYDQKVIDTIERAARKFGIAPTIVLVGEPTNHAVSAVTDAIAEHDCVIYLARLGDQSRFDEIAPGKKSVMCYVRDGSMLASPFCQTTYQAMKSFKDAIDDILLGAKTITLTCPLGTNLTGSVSTNGEPKKSDVSVFRFPLGVPQPLSASHFSGRVAISRFLTPTGSRVYKPASVTLSKLLFANIKNGRIDGFEGDTKEVEIVRAHYDKVAEEFGIERDIVHSWHAGIHPACAYMANAAENPDRWSNTAFGNPRIVHFHSCGDYAPAEICWIVVDQTIVVDGTVLWDHGRLRPENFEKTEACLEIWPELKTLFANPVQEIGVTNQTQ